MRPDSSTSSVLATKTPVEHGGYKIEEEPASTFTLEKIKDDWEPRRQWPDRRLAIDVQPARAPTATYTPTSDQAKWEKLFELQQESLKLMKELGGSSGDTSTTSSKFPDFPQGSMQCPVCKKDFSTSYRAKNHYRLVHLKKSPWSCSICGKQCSSQATLDTHVQDQHVKKNYKCNFCNHYFTTKAALGGHMVTHNRYMKAKPENICEHCLQVFVDLYGHQRTCKHKLGKAKESTTKHKCRYQGCYSEFGLAKHRNYHEKKHCKFNPDSEYCKKQKGK